MQCTAAFCHGQLVFAGGENTEDYGCSNWKYPNVSCPASRELLYHTAVKVRRDWYFLAQYNLPFKWVDVGRQQPEYNYDWYALVGNPESGKTELHGLKLSRRLNLSFNQCIQEPLYIIDYVALPANGDFKDRFNELRDRVMNEWLSAGPRLSRFEAFHAALDNRLYRELDRIIQPQIPTTQYGEEPERSDYGLFPTYVSQQEEVERASLIEWPLPTITDRVLSFNLVPSPHRTLMTMDSLTGDVSGPAPNVPQVKTNTQISIDAEVRQLIETATSDTPDEAAEHAALEACKKLKRKLNG